jgi:prepilin-type processing-associated H-X9-DG protein
VVVVAAILFVAAVLFPIFAPRPVVARKSVCQNNLKELGLALSIYCRDNDGTLPSSYLCGGSKTWNRRNFVRFAGTLGDLSASASAAEKTWPMLLHKYTKNDDLFRCPSDKDKSDGPNATLSYYYKAAVDRAWYGDNGVKAQKEDDFEYSSDQVVFWEHNGWHWGQADQGVTDGTSINVAYLDGHVAAKRIQNSGYTLQENPPGPLPGSGMGEPAWFSKNMKSGKSSIGTYWNPKVHGDCLD